MVTYVLMLAKVFPNSHYRAGEETGFKDKLAIGEKIHTIRANYPLWEKRINKVQKGEAVVSIRQWEDQPYKSKQIEIATLTNDNGVGIEKLYLKPSGQTASTLDDFPGLDKNDGLSKLDWIVWFEKYDRTKPLAIIHFTPFRYNVEKD